MDTSRPAIDRARRERARAAVAGLAASAVLAAVLGRANADAAPNAQPVPIHDIREFLPDIGQHGGVVRGFVADGHTGYATVGARFVAFDLSDPRRPVPRGYSEPLPGLAADIAVTRFHAYVALAGSEHGVAVVSIADYRRPILRSLIFGRASAVDAQGDRLVVAGSETLDVYDIASPGRPVRLGRLALETLNAGRIVVLDGERAFAALSNPDTAIVEVDLSDPRAPRIASSLALGGSGRVSSLVLADDRLLATSIRRLHVVDAAVPGALRELGSALLGDEDDDRILRSVAVEGGRTVAVGYEGFGGGIGQLWTLDVADPSAPQVLARIDLPAPLETVSLRGHTALAGERGGRLRVVDVAALAQPAEAGAIVPPGPARELVVAGPFGYHAHWEGGLQVLDLADPVNPRDAGVAPTDRPAVPMAAAGGILYAWEPRGASDGSIALYDLAQPRLPALLGRVDAPPPTSIAAAGGTMLAVSRGLLEAYDVGDPVRPTRVGSLAIDGAAGVALNGSHAYVAAGERGLRVLDVASPAALREVGAVELPQGRIDHVIVDGTTAYVGGRGLSAAAIDVSDPTAPRALWTRDDGSALRPHAYENGRLVTVCELDLCVYHDVGPEGAGRLEAWPIPGLVEAVAFSARHLVVAAGEAGVLVIPWLDERRANPIWLPALHR